MLIKETYVIHKKPNEQRKGQILQEMGTCIVCQMFSLRSKAWQRKYYALIAQDLLQLGWFQVHLQLKHKKCQNYTAC